MRTRKEGQELQSEVQAAASRGLHSLDPEFGSDSGCGRKPVKSLRQEGLHWGAASGVWVAAEQAVRQGGLGLLSVRDMGGLEGGGAMETAVELCLGCGVDGTYT